jgi:hypothetical protein
MSEQQNFGFGKFVPGFDFLQNLGKGASQAQAALPTLSSWVAPTLNVEELDKRITELKAVHFWLDQNSKALTATIQALELQKMTLATLKGMNFNMADIANALKLDPGAGAGAPSGSMAEAATEAIAKARADKASKRKDKGVEDQDARPADAGASGAAKPAAGVVDPLQWWGALTQQFQQIATDAMKESARSPTPASPAAADPTPANKRPAAGKRAASKKAVGKRVRDR